MNDTSSDILRRVAGFLGTTGVGLGALGAHKLHKTLLERNMLENWRTAVLYQLFHATAILGVAALCQVQENQKPGSSSQLKLAGQLMSIGSVMFSGSIYLLCFGVGPKKILGPMTPLGGLVMISGWALLGLSPSSSPS